MAEYLLRNSLNPGKVIKCSITFVQLTNKGDDGEASWLIEIGTLEPHKDGGSIPPTFVHYVATTDLDEAIREATERIALQVDWGELLVDDRPPYVSYSYPSISDVTVDMFSSIIIDIEDDIPGAGIDPDSITFTVNGYDITSEVEVFGTPYKYRVRWDPGIRVLDYY